MGDVPLVKSCVLFTRQLFRLVELLTVAPSAASVPRMRTSDSSKRSGSVRHKLKK